MNISQSNGLSQAVSLGGLVALEAIRDSLAADLELCRSFRDRAALYRRLVDVLQTIEALRPGADQPVDEIDLIRARRERYRGARRVPVAAASSVKAGLADEVH